MESFETQYTPNLTYEQILSFPAKFIDRWAFDQTFMRTGGSVTETQRILAIPYTGADDLQSCPSEDLLLFRWLNLFGSDLAGCQSTELPMPELRYLQHTEMGTLWAFRIKYCQDLLSRFDGNKIDVSRSLQIEEWRFNRYLRPAAWVDEDDSALDWDRDKVSESRAVQQHDPKKSAWIDVRDVSDLDDQDAKYIVQSGNNYQLDVVYEFDAELIDKLSNHEGELCFGFHGSYWNPDFASKLTRMAGKFVGSFRPDLLSEFECLENWENSCNDAWFTELLQSFVDQGETDFHWVRRLTADQADILLNSETRSAISRSFG